MKKKLSLIVYVIFSAVLILSFTDVLHAGSDLSAEVDKYVNMLKSDSVKIRTDAAKRIYKSRFTDPEPLTIMKEKLLKEYNLHPNSISRTDEMAWYCLALASSGNTDYMKTLTTVAEKAVNVILKRHANDSRVLVLQYAKSDKITAAALKVNNNLSPEINKYIGLLKSNDFGLIRNAAKSITRARFTEEKLYDVINEELLKGYKILPKDRGHIDAMAWLCKALGASGMAKYKPTFQEVSENSSNKKLRRYAKKQLKKL